MRSYAEQVARRIVSGLSHDALARIACWNTPQPCGHRYAEHAGAVEALLAAGWHGGSADEILTDGRTSFSPDAIAARSVVPLTEHEAVDAAAVFHELLKREDPQALTRTIEHVLKMRYQDPTKPA